MKHTCLLSAVVLAASFNMPLWAYELTPPPAVGSAGQLAFSDSRYSGDEGQPISVSITRNGGDLGAVSIRYTTSNGTAIAGEDYSSSTGTVSWNTGETGSRLIEIPTTRDNLFENSETFRISLSDASGGAALGATTEATITINNVSAGQIGFATPQLRINETNATAQITVNRLNGSSGAASVRYQTADGTSFDGQDYRATSGVLTWADGDSSPRTFNVELINDNRREEDETILLNLSELSDGVVGGLLDAVIIIVNDDIRADADLTSVAQNPTQQAIAETLDSIDEIGSADPELQMIIDDLINNVEDNPMLVANALQQIAPEELITQGRLTTDVTSAQMRNLQSRLYRLRRGVGCVDASGVNANIDGENVNVQQVLSPDVMCRKAKKLSFFAAGNINTGDKDATDRESGFDFDTQGITVGADYQINPQLVLGAAVGYAQTDAELSDQAGQVDVDGYSLSLYGTYYQNNNFFVDWLYTYGSSEFENSRSIRYALPGTAINQTAVSANDAEQHGFSIGIGYNYLRKRWAITPTLSFEYLRADIDSFDENLDANAAGSALGVHIDEQEIDSLRLKAGYHLTYLSPQSWGLLMPMTSFHLIHEMDNKSRYLTGHFLNDLGRNQFAIETDRPDRGYANFGLGLYAQFGEDTAAFINYETQLMFEDYDTHALTAGVQIGF